MRISVTLLLSLFFTSQSIDAQRLDSVLHKMRHTFFMIKYNDGAVLNTNDFVNGHNGNESKIDSYQSFSIGYGKQTSGQADWEHLHNFPSFGVAFYTARFRDGSEIGYPNALYGFYNAPFHRWQRSALMYRIGFGLTYNWRPYHRDDNPFNVAIGSYRTVYVGFGVGYDYFLSDHWVLSAGLEATHFSNGAIQKPNKGINLAAPYVSVRYGLGHKPKFQRKLDIESKPNNEVYFGFGVGVKREEFDTLKYAGLKDAYQDVMYRVYTFSSGIMRQYSPKGKAGIGADLIYDEWLGSTITVNANGNADKVLSSRASDRYAVGVYGAHEFCVHRLSIVTQVGTYVWRKDVPNKKFNVYQRAGLKYHFRNDMFVGLNIFAHRLSKADFIEWNAGYRFRWGS